LSYPNKTFEKMKQFEMRSKFNVFKCLRNCEIPYPNTR